MDLQLAALAAARAGPTRGVETEGRLTIRRERYHASVSLKRLQLLVDDLVGGLLYRHTFEGDEVADFPSYAKADKVLAAARGGDGTGLVGSVGARADDGRVAHAARHLALQATSRSAGGDVAPAIERDYSRGAVAARVAGFVIKRNRLGYTLRRRRCPGGTRRNGLAFFRQLLHQRLPAGFGEKETWIDLLQAVARAEGFGAGANHHHVRRLLHHRACQAYGMTCVGDAGHRAGFEIGAVHDGRVQFVLSFRGEDRAMAGVEERIVFENIQHCLNRIESRAAAVQHLCARFSGRGEAGAIGRVALGAECHPLNDSRAAMHHDGPFVGGRLLGGRECREREDAGDPITNAFHWQSLPRNSTAITLYHFFGIVNSAP